jgi:hypothetical protein
MQLHFCKCARNIFLQVFQRKLCVCLSGPHCVLHTTPTQSSFRWISTVIIRDVQNITQLLNIPAWPATAFSWFSLVSPYITLSALLCSFLNMRDQVQHPSIYYHLSSTRKLKLI